jgi:hypothetical protein
MITVTVSNSDLLAALNAQVNGLNDAVKFAVGQTALAVESQAKHNFQGAHTRKGNGWSPSGHIPGSPDFPNVRTGNLRRSITTTVREGLGTYSAQVGPSMVYARAVELGNGRGGAGYPYMEPAYRQLKPQVNDIFRRALVRRMK